MMVSVTRLNNTAFFLNPDLVEFIEETPDTVLTLSTGKKLVVSESAAEVVARITEYKRSLFGALPKIVSENTPQ